MNNNISETQKEICNNIERFRVDKGLTWNKFRGDTTCRVFMHFIEKEILKFSNEYSLSFPNAFLKGYPTEFDFLVVTRGAEPDKFTNRYNPEDVKILFEIKTSGTMPPKEKREEFFEKIKSPINFLIKESKHINYLYLTYQETKSYLEATKKHLVPYQVFCLKNYRIEYRTEDLIGGEWEKLIIYIKDLLS